MGELFAKVLQLLLIQHFNEDVHGFLLEVGLRFVGAEGAEDCGV